MFCSNILDWCILKQNNCFPNKINIRFHDIFNETIIIFVETNISKMQIILKSGNIIDVSSNNLDEMWEAIKGAMEIKSKFIEIGTNKNRNNNHFIRVEDITAITR